MKIAVLPDRGVVSVSGPDALKLLQGLVTNDVAELDAAPAMHAGLLSPQGKILFDFFVVRTRDGALLEVARDRAAELVKRVKLYKLRADVSIADVSDAHAVLALFGPGAHCDGPRAYPDPRLPALGWRAIVAAGEPVEATADAADYHRERIALGVPEGGRDYAFGDTFPHEALFDQLNGVSFTKGCYVGQEIVSRMEHRGTARSRVVSVIAVDGALVSGTPVKAGEVEIGTIGSVAGARGLALIRLDRATDFAEKGVALRAGEAEIKLALPDWASFKPATGHR